jgi:mannose-1-phosphate guanylyltransferase
LPADHLNPDVELFQADLLEAANYAYDLGGLITLGIPPTRPETGYGYIQIESGKPGDGIFKVATFAEKPNYATAVRFLQSGDFMWNSGMFIWKASVILDEISIFLPELFEQINTLKPAIDTENFDEMLEMAYSQIKGISIDYGIMEKSHCVYLIKASFNWSDVGSWEEVYHLSQKDDRGNSTTGNVFTNMTHDSYIYSPEKFTSVIGVDNLIIINTKDSLLVCRRDQAQEVKQIVDHLKHNNMSDLL